MKTLKQFLDGLISGEVKEGPSDEEFRAALELPKIPDIKHIVEQMKVQTVEADMKRVKEEVVFILSNCVKVLRSDNEDEREAAAEELETWLKNANPTKH